jgi:uncharacterized protein YbaR (Trm112 family)
MTQLLKEPAVPAGADGLNQALLKLLVCPKCRGPLLHRLAEKTLDCQSCLLRFLIEDGIPVLMSDRAETLRP